MAGSRERRTELFPSQDIPLPAGKAGLLVLGVLLFIFLLSVTDGCLGGSSPAFSRAADHPPDAGPAGYALENIVVNASFSRHDDDRQYAANNRTAAAIRQAMDSKNPVTRDFAVSHIPQVHGGKFNAAQVADLWEAVYTRWTYVEDPRGTEYFSPASRTIALGLKGDCDDFAILTAALIESVGGSSRIVYARNGTEGHAYPEVYIGNTEEEYRAVAGYLQSRYGAGPISRHVTYDGTVTRYWLNLDWWSDQPGGRFFADDGTRTAYYPDGRWEQITS